MTFSGFAKKVKGYKLKIMLVDTEIRFMERLASKIKEKGLKIYTASSTDDALNMVKKRKIDMVILNMKVLQRAGIQLISNIKKIRPLTEVIMLTDPQTIHLSIEGMKLGAFGEIYLPPNIDTLKEMIKNIATRNILHSFRDHHISASFAETGNSKDPRKIMRKEDKEDSKTFKSLDGKEAL